MLDGGAGKAKVRGVGEEWRKGESFINKPKPLH
jgi:hypothetical protein